MRRPGSGRAAAPGRAAILLGLALLGTGALTGCGNDNPAGPDWNGPSTVRFVDPTGSLAGQQALILQLVDATIDSVSSVRPVTGVTITVRSSAAGAIAGWGIGGYTPNATTVEISVDPGYADLATILPQRLPGILAHELHHVFRWRGPGYGNTLLQAMVSEGLADRFAIELLGVPVPPWSDALAPGEVSTYLDLARPEFDSPSYDHARWFYGSTAQVPRWTGYTLGYRIVSDYQAAHGGASALDLVDTPAGSFRPD